MATYYTSRYSGEEIDKLLDRVSGMETNPAAALARLGAGVRPNLLLNPFFAVNQRGQTMYTTAGYAIDRFKLVAGTITVTDNGINISSNNSTYGYAIVNHIIEDMKKVYGKPVALSILTTQGLNTSVGIISESVERVVTGYSSHGSYIRAYFMGDNIIVEIVALSNYDPDIIAVKLELGNTQTLGYQDEDGAWHLLPQPESDYATQLARCQRYYWQSEMLYATNNYVSGAHLLCNVRYPVRMRTTPAVTLMSHLGTPNQVSQWGSGIDSGITVAVNSAYANCEGFDSIVATSGAFLDVECYAFRVVATAEL